jgi:hypothetical protein
MLKEKISPFIDEIRSIEGVEPYALVSLDGIMPGNILTGNLMRHGLKLSLQQSLHPLSQSEGLLT